MTLISSQASPSQDLSTSLDTRSPQPLGELGSIKPSDSPPHLEPHPSHQPDIRPRTAPTVDPYYKVLGLEPTYRPDFPKERLLLAAATGETDALREHVARLPKPQYLLTVKDAQGRDALDLALAADKVKSVEAIIELLFDNDPGESGGAAGLQPRLLYPRHPLALMNENVGDPQFDDPGE